MNAVKSMVGTALLWAALAALIHVPSSGSGTRAVIVATLGFVAFAAGLGLLIDSLKRDIVRQLRRERDHETA